MTYQKFDTTNPSSTSPYVEGRLDHIEEGIAALAAPSANNVILYAKDDGSGKTQLVARFATGAVQVIATQP